MADRSRERLPAAPASRRSARRDAPVGRDARLCRVEGRDRLDVALFQCGSVGEPCPMRLLLGAGFALKSRSQSGWHSKQRLAHPNHFAEVYTLGERPGAWREHHNSRAMLEPSHLVAFFIVTAARDQIWASIGQVEWRVDAIEPDRGNQNGGDRHEGQQITIAKPRLDHSALVLAK